MAVHDFEAFVRARSGALARIAYLLTGDRHAAEDLLRDTLARVAERWRAVTRGGRDPDPYVRRVLYTRAVDGWRHRRRRAEVLLPAPPELAGASGSAEAVVRRAVRIGIEEMSLDGRTGRLTLLRPSSPWRRGFPGQWTAAASPDGSRLVMVEENSQFPRLHMYSLLDGRERGGPVWVRYVTPCGISWVGDSPAVPIHQPVVKPGGISSYVATAVVENGRERRIVAVEPKLKPMCLVWATDALAGEPRGGRIFGTNDLFVTWWGEEAAALLALVVGLVLLLRRHRRRRTERHPAAST